MSSRSSMVLTSETDPKGRVLLSIDSMVAEALDGLGTAVVATISIFVLGDSEPHRS